MPAKFNHRLPSDDNIANNRYKQKPNTHVDTDCMYVWIPVCGFVNDTLVAHLFHTRTRAIVIR